MKSPGKGLRMESDQNAEYDGVDISSRLMNLIFDMPLKQQLALLNKLDRDGHAGTRKSVRTHLKKPLMVSVDHDDPFLSDNYFIKDIGRSGVRIETNRSFESGETVTMRFELPNSRRMFKIDGEIVWRRKNGMGVKFLHQPSLIDS